jgi:hypothetical protein
VTTILRHRPIGGQLIPARAGCVGERHALARPAGRAAPRARAASARPAGEDGGAGCRRVARRARFARILTAPVRIRFGSSRSSFRGARQPHPMPSCITGTPFHTARYLFLVCCVSVCPGAIGLAGQWGTSRARGPALSGRVRAPGRLLLLVVNMPCRMACGRAWLRGPPLRGTLRRTVVDTLAKSGLNTTQQAISVTFCYTMAVSVGPERGCRRARGARAAVRGGHGSRSPVSRS